MKTIAVIFNQEGKVVWNTNNVFSVGIQAESSVFDYETGWDRVEKFLYWVKSNDSERATTIANETIKKLTSGSLVLARVFSKTPFHEKDTMDINPETGASLERYSKVVICTPARRDEIHRQFVPETTVIGNTEPVPSVV